MVRCVNIDWLEVHARESTEGPRDVAYYVSKGYFVEDRGYGTRVYEQMFTVHVYGFPFIEVRRQPKRGNGNGIHDDNECHLRLVNRACYYNNAATLMEQFLKLHGYTDVRIKRIDICLDFSTFDSGDIPASFVARYFRHKYAKINQSNISGHGKDEWQGQTWNSVSWGSPHSQVYTKLYNKTMELYDIRTGSFKKPYILQAWLACGLIDSIETCSLEGKTVDIWRLEFTIQSPRADWMTIELDGKQRKFQSLQNTLETYADRPKCFVMFASLARHYFRFKYFEEGKRKDRCRDKVLFKFNDVETFYKLKTSDRGEQEIVRDAKIEGKWGKLRELLVEYQQEYLTYDVKQSVSTIIENLDYSNMRKYLRNPWDEKELADFESFLAEETERLKMQESAQLNEERTKLGIKNRTLEPFRPQGEQLEKGGTIVPPSDFQSDKT